MVSFWNKLKDIFLKKEKKKLDKEFKENKLLYIGDEPECWACQIPIHESEFRRKINGKLMHRKCFKKLAKIAQSGGSINEF